VLNVDIDPTAIEASRTLSARLGRHARGMRFAVADAGAWTMDLAEFDVVYMAALVGLSAGDKAAKIEGIVARMRPGALLVVRSCNDLKLCLYPVSQGR
jgi:SAM-dependent methyltransferase